MSGFSSNWIKNTKVFVQNLMKNLLVFQADMCECKHMHFRL